VKKKGFNPEAERSLWPGRKTETAISTEKQVCGRRQAKWSHGRDKGDLEGDIKADIEADHMAQDFRKSRLSTFTSESFN